MAATIKRLRTAPQKAADGDADQLRLLLDRRPDLLPDRVATQVIASLDKREPSRSDWTFLMVSPAQNKAVILWLKANSRQPLNAMQLWAELLDNMRRDTGEVAMTREELAEAVGMSAAEVSRTMTELETAGAISRKRQKVDGMRGPGTTHYFVNPMIATNLTGQARDKAQAAFPKPYLVPSTSAS
jgi:CRP-like cAMP-binding protein